MPTPLVTAPLTRFAALGIDALAIQKGDCDRPSVLGRYRGSSLEVALEVLEAAGTLAEPTLPRLRQLRPRKPPTWRERIERCIRSIERDVAEAGR